jgi:hypothetical protein
MVLDPKQLLQTLLYQAVISWSSKLKHSSYIILSSRLVSLEGTGYLHQL